MIPNTPPSNDTDALEPVVFQASQDLPTTSTEAIEYPVLAPNVQLAGELQESGFKDQQWLIQRDGQFIQLSELLYRVAEQANGEHTHNEIAAEVTEVTEWIVSPDNVRQIIQTKLIPMGIISSVNSSPDNGLVVKNRVASPLAVNLRMKMIGPRFIDPITRVLQVLYLPYVIIPILAIIAVAHEWLYLVHGSITHIILETLSVPGRLLTVLALLLVAGVFHEFGHASALRYGGGKVRGMGIGLYLIYPALYTDVTDCYRLGRWARVRTDLGGFYFGLLFALGIMVFSLLSGQEFLLSVVVLIDLDILFQNLPFVRMDGYWALTDLTGIPDFFSQIGPFLRSVLPVPAWKGNRLPGLKPWVKVVFASYICVTIFVLVTLLSFTIINAPTIVLTSWNSLRIQQGALANEQSTHNYSGMVLLVVQMLLTALPLWASVYMFINLGRGPIRAAWNWSKRTPKRSIIGALGTTGTIVLVAFFWMPQLIFTQEPTQLSRTVDGIPCDQAGHTNERIFTHLTIFVKNRAVAVPENVGIPTGGQCAFWLQTSGTDGVIHVEAPMQRAYTLGQFMDIWAQTQQTSVLKSSSFLGYPLKGHQLTIWISSNEKPAVPYTGNLRDLMLQNFELVTIAYDSPQAKPMTHFDWKN